MMTEEQKSASFLQMKCLFLFWRGCIFTVELEAVQAVSLGCMAVLVHFIEFTLLLKY